MVCNLTCLIAVVFVADDGLALCSIGAQHVDYGGRQGDLVRGIGCFVN